MSIPTAHLSAEAKAAAEFANQHLWRASQLSAGRTRTWETGHALLDQELPGGGWPQSTMIELLIRESGIGEMQLLQPILGALTSKGRRIAIVNPPHIPNADACQFLDNRSDRLMWIRPTSSANALWAADEVLRAGCFGGVLLWITNARDESLRRLALSAHTTETMFWVLRPLTCAQDASPSPLRLALRPASGGLLVDVVKRHGPHQDAPIFVPLPTLPAHERFRESDYEILAQRASAATAARVHTPALV